MARDDRQLVSLVRAGSADAARELFERHWRQAWKTAHVLVGSEQAADDIAQDAFVRAFGSLADFNGRSSFGTWLYRIVVNRAVDVMRAEERRRRQGLVQHTGEHDETEVPAAVREAVAALDSDRRIVVALRFWLDLTPTEIADLLTLPVGTVHSRLSRGLADLRVALGEVHDEGQH